MQPAVTRHNGTPRLVLGSMALACLMGCGTAEDYESIYLDATDEAEDPKTVPLANGLSGLYFDNVDFTSPKLTRVDATVAFAWGRGSPSSLMGDPDTFSVRWEGYVKANYSQTYTFYTQADDGTRLWVNNQLLVSDWTDHGTKENKGTIALEQGKTYPIKLEYYENRGGAVAKLLWSSSSQAKQIIPATQLFTSDPARDECPKDPNKLVPGTCGCGVADTDGDSDGAADCKDVCPRDPAKVVAGSCGCNVPEGTCSGDPFKCDIACGPGTVLSRACGASTTTRDERECNEERAACCVGETQPCPSLCAPGQEFLDDATLRGRTCQVMADELEAGALACTNPGVDVRYACCRNTVVPQPVASSPCYDFCGDTRQLVGSRIVPDGTATCWDYSLSISATSAMCTFPDPAIKNACCGELRPPKPERYNYCCLCEGCYSGTRHDYPIGPEGRTCTAVDYEMFSLPRDGDACNATKEAFRSTCCDPSYEPPPPVPGEMVQVPPCARPNPPGYCNSSYPRCDLCKNGSYPKLPNTITTIAYVSGNPSCNDLYWMGREGAIPAALCFPIQNFMEGPCGCK